MCPKETPGFEKTGAAWAHIAVIQGKCSVTLVSHFDAKWSCFNPWRILLRISE